MASDINHAHFEQLIITNKIRLTRNDNIVHTINYIWCPEKSAHAVLSDDTDCFSAFASINNTRLMYHYNSKITDSDIHRIYLWSYDIDVIGNVGQIIRHDSVNESRTTVMRKQYLHKILSAEPLHRNHITSISKKNSGWREPYTIRHRGNAAQPTQK